MTAESLTTRLARERLASIKRFIPLRDSVRNKLQQRQEMQTDFSSDTQQLFSPIIKATGDVKLLQNVLCGGKRIQRKNLEKKHH